MTETGVIEYVPNQPVTALLNDNQVPKAAHPAMAEWRRLDDLITDELEIRLAEYVNGKGAAANIDDKQAREAIKAGKPFKGAAAEADRAKGEADTRRHLATARQMHAEQGRAVIRELKTHRDAIAKLAEPRIRKAADAYTQLLDTIDAQAAPLIAELTEATAALGALVDLDTGGEFGPSPMPVGEPSLGDARATLLAIMRRVDTINEKGLPARITIKWLENNNIQELTRDVGMSFIGSGVAVLVED